MWSSPFLDVTRSENCASSRPQDRRRSDTTVICDWVSGSPGLFFCRYNRWMALVGRCNKRDQPPVLINMFRHSPAADNDKMNCVFDFPKYFNRVCWWYLHVDEMIWLIYSLCIVPAKMLLVCILSLFLVGVLFSTLFFLLRYEIATTSRM